jgi:hypothetical protein
MSSTTGSQNLLVNVFRPVYTYNSGTFSSSLQLSNIGTDFTAAIGDSEENVYVGINAGNSSTNTRACVSNTALGYNAAGLISNVSNSTFVGANAGSASSNSSNVISIGNSAGGSGSNNIFLGNSTKSLGDNNILIGHAIDGVASSNLLRVGSSIYGNLSNRWVGIGTDTATGGNQFDVSGNAAVSGTLTATSLNVASFAPSNLIVPGYIRNALTPSQIDISGGNISNSGVVTTNIVRSANGSAAAPTHSFVSDVSLGIYRAGANQLAFATAGVQRMVIDGSFVGIGVAAPQTALEVRDVSATIRATATGPSPNPGFELNRSQERFGTSPITDWRMQTGLGGFQLLYARTEVSGSRLVSPFFISHTTANVGIGTTSPAFALDVSGDTNITGTLTAGSLSIPSLSPSNLVVSGYIRNALTPSQFDISGGNISNSATITTSNTRAANGTVAAPTYAFVSDPSLGLYRVGANQLGFTSAGVQRMVISNGNVGIGTNAPFSALDVGAVGAYITVNRLGNIPNSTDVSMIVEGSKGVGMWIQKGDNNLFCGLSFKTLSNDTFAERMRIDANTGRMGIGQPAPLTVLDVSGRARIVADGSSSLGSWGLNNNTDTLILQHTGDYSRAADLGKSASILFANGTLNYPQARIVSEMTSASAGGFTANLLFQTNGEGVSLAERMRIHTNGNIGIRTSTPAYALDISGTTQTSNALVTGYLRNALTPTQFDISGGNISNSGSITANRVFTRNLYAPSTSDVSAISYLNMGTGADNGAGTYSQNLQFLWMRSGGGPLRYSGINYGSYNTNSFMTYNNGSSLVTKYIAALPTAQSQLDACGSILTLTTSGRVGVNTEAPSFNLDVSGTMFSSNAIHPGYIRNALVPTQFDISGGNISNSGALVTSNIRAGAPGNVTVTAVQEFGRGYDNLGSTGAGITPAIAFQFNGSGYRHFIRSRHNDGVADWGNAIDFFTNTGGQTASTAPGTGNVIAMAVTSGGVGLRMSNPIYPLDVSGITRTTNALIGGYIRNAVTPTTFDISGGNISNSGTIFSRGNITVSNANPFLGYLISNDVGSRWQMGMYNSTGGGNGGAFANALFFGFNDAARMYLDTSGNLGVGIIPSIYRFDVRGSNNNTAIIRSTSTQSALEVVGNNGAAGTGMSVLHTSTNQGFYAGNSLPMVFMTGASGTPKMSILAGGNVGIGNTNPTALLDISGSAGGSTTIRARNTVTEANIRVITGNFGDSSGLTIYQAPTEHGIYSENAMPFYIYSGGTRRLTILSNGNVGVGNTNPQYELDVDAGTTAASVNMSSWPRVPVGNTYIAKGVIAYPGGTGLGVSSPVRFSNALQNINTELATVTNDVTNGTYVTIKKSGIWSIQAGPFSHNGGGGGTSVMDVSTGITQLTMPPLRPGTLDSAQTASGITSALKYTGFLPSNAGLYYKVYHNNTQLTTNSNCATFVLSFIAETPAGPANYPI